MKLDRDVSGQGLGGSGQSPFFARKSPIFK